MENKHTNTELVTIGAVKEQLKAYMLKAFLEEAGITVFLQNEMSSQLYGNMLEIKIQVSDTDAKKARDLLNESGYVL
ncbi:MAG: DUF2007 domain-containing protein [Bacteroidales bacterium]|jgi:hypothetical protein|nr:DUF2007 domain-containing protein [Bacteroidales bacterium]